MLLKSAFEVRKRRGAYMGYVEQGRYAPSLEVLNKIAKVLKINAGQLLPF
jgi:DNA-binding XRE family transcriptional regulator